jgi:hypothetical protein
MRRIRAPGGHEAARWWHRSDEFFVPGVGLHRRAAPGGRFDLSQICTGTSEEIAAQMAAISIAVMDAIRVFEAEA